MSESQKSMRLNRDNAQFLLQAAMPIVIAIIGVIFTYSNSRRQIEFQQIQVADAMVSQVRTDDGFTKDKLDLQLNFVEKMFRDENFKKQVKDLLLQTYSVNLKADAEQLGELALSDDPEDIQYVQSRITEARKFGDTSINAVVKQLEKNDAVKVVADAGAVEEKVKDQMEAGTLNAATVQQLENAMRRLPQDSSLKRLLKKAERNQQGGPSTGPSPAEKSEKKEPEVRGKSDDKSEADTTKRKNQDQKKKKKN